MHGKTWRRISILLFVAAVLMALRLIGPAIPNEIRMLAGPQGSTFYADGLQYKETLERHGVTVHLEETSGSLANLADMVEADMPTAGFLLGLSDPTGAERPAPEGIESLGTVGLQPSWVFASRSADLDELQDLKGSRIEAGGTESDARVLALFLLREEGIDNDVKFARHATTADQALEALESKRVAAILAVGEPDSPLIDTLLRSDRLQVLPIRRADAFAIRYRFLKRVRFPEGAHDLRTNIPDQDLQLLAVRTQLVVSDLFPPAVADLLLQAAKEIHGDATPFSARGEFPRPDTASLPLSRAADNFYTNGPPRLQRFLPFRLASLVNRFLTAGIAIGSSAVAIFSIVPALVGLPFKLKVTRSYRELEAIERLAAAGGDRKTLLEQLAKVDGSTAAIGVPLRSLETQWFELRQYIHDMNDRLQAL